MKSLAFILCGIALATTPGIAFEPREPFPHTVASENGKYQFDMIPAVMAEEPVDHIYPVVRAAHGIAYEIQSDGSRKELWRVEGWYSFQLFLSNSGAQLVRVESFIYSHFHEAEGEDLGYMDNLPCDEDIGLEFYSNGRKIRQHRVTELLADLDKADDQMGGYSWCHRYILNADREFELTTNDHTEFRFDTRTGEIIERRPPELLEPFVGLSPRQLEKLAVSIGLVSTPIDLAEFPQSLDLKNWENRTVDGLDLGTPAIHRLFLPISSIEDPRGYFQLAVDVHGYSAPKNGEPESGTVIGIRLLFQYPDGIQADCFERMSPWTKEAFRQAQYIESKVREYRVQNPQTQNTHRQETEKPMPACEHWFSEYYQRSE